MTFYKALCTGGIGPYSNVQWNMPHGDRLGEWMPLIDEVVECESGYHFCRRKDLIGWLETEIYEIEVRGKVYKYDDKCAAHEAQLIRKLDTWTDRTARLFAADCAEHVLSIFEKEYPKDKRPRKAIEATRQFALGEISKEDLSAAGAAAKAAARNAAWAAAKAAARDAARNAAWAAAGAAAGDAAGDAAWAAERSWQTDRLFEYLEGEL